MEFEEMEESEGKKFITILLFIVFVSVIFLFIFFISIRTRTPVCGDGICNGNENKCICPEDCGLCNGSCGLCMEYKCVSNKCSCIQSEDCCGNGICERGEDEWSCCIDCNCSITGMKCNAKTNSCEVPPSNITDEMAIEIAKKYFNLTSFDEYNVTISDTIFKNESSKFVCLYQKDIILTGVCIVIDKSGKVVSEYYV